VQVEYHPFLDQSAMLAYLREHKIPLTAYAPLAQGRAAEHETLKRSAALPKDKRYFTPPSRPTGTR
jgi:2,5-diketo-D-gluconate reductase B